MKLTRHCLPGGVGGAVGNGVVVGSGKEISLNGGSL